MRGVLVNSITANVMYSKKQRKGKKFFINNTSFIVNQIFCKLRMRNTLENGKNSLKNFERETSLKKLKPEFIAMQLHLLLIACILHWQLLLSLPYILEDS